MPSRAGSGATGFATTRARRHECERGADLALRSRRALVGGIQPRRAGDRLLQVVRRRWAACSRRRMWHGATARALPARRHRRRRLRHLARHARTRPRARCARGPRPAEPLRAGDARARASAGGRIGRSSSAERSDSAASAITTSKPFDGCSSISSRAERSSSTTRLRSPSRVCGATGRRTRAIVFRASTATRASGGSPRTARSSSSAHGSSRSIPSRNESSSRCEPG